MQGGPLRASPNFVYLIFPGTAEWCQSFWHLAWCLNTKINALGHSIKQKKTNIRRRLIFLFVSLKCATVRNWQKMHEVLPKWIAAVGANDMTIKSVIIRAAETPWYTELHAIVTMSTKNKLV